MVRGLVDLVEILLGVLWLRLRGNISSGASRGGQGCLLGLGLGEVAREGW